MARAGWLSVPCLLALLLGGCGEEPAAPPPAPVEQRAEMGADPQPVTLEGVAATVTPPAGAWLVRTDRPGPDRWTEQYRREADGVLLQAATFPVQASRGPSQVIATVIDSFVRSRGTDGFGQQGRGAGLLRGAPAAWTGFVTVIGGTRHTGRARIVLLEPDRWALALGLAPDPAGPEALALVTAFVDSLTPLDATFYARRFVDPQALAATAARADGESPVTRRDIAAVQLVIEVATGVRFPLAAQESLRRALTAEANQGGASSREAFREVARALDASAAMDPAERRAGMASLGKRILEQLFERALEGYAPANDYRLIWTALGKPVVEAGDVAVSAAALRSLVEMSAFLASLAADREVPVTEDLAAAIRGGLAARFAGLDAAEQTDLIRAGAWWAGLRHAWDHAARDERVRFRRAVLHALLPPAERAAVPPAEDDVALLDLMHARAEDGPAYALRAAALDAAARRALFALLDVDPERPHLGW